MRSLIRKFVDLNVRASKAIDELFIPFSCRIDGNSDFVRNIVPCYLSGGQTIYDIGGGKRPYLDLKSKQALDARVIGVDISQSELDLAPEGAYDEKICEDISKFCGQEDGDLVICQAVLEHVSNTGGAFKAISTILRPGGLALIFVPSRNAVFARLNLILSERLKRALLHTIYPSTKAAQGFKSYYEKCTPSDFAALANISGFDVVEFRPYFVSSYFRFFVPLYVIWRIWIMCFKLLRGNQAAETFFVALRKR